MLKIGTEISPSLHVMHRCGSAITEFCHGGGSDELDEYVVVELFRNENLKVMKAI